MTASRSLRTDVRNPLVSLPSMARLQRFVEGQPVAGSLLRDVLSEISSDARVRADKCWRTHKAPMAAYWKAVAVYAGHLRRGLR